MNGDPYLFYAFLVLFGLGCLIVGWQARRLTEERQLDRFFHDTVLDESDEAGA